MSRSGSSFSGLLLAKLTGDLVDPRFIFFALVGTTGLAVHLIVLKLALAAGGETFLDRAEHRNLRRHDQQLSSSTMN